MSFRLLRVKRRADQDPASSLYLPVLDPNTKRICSDVENKEFRLFKLVERGPQKPVKILKPIERTEEACRVILLSETTSASTVADAILVGNDFDKKKLSKLVKETSEYSDRFETFNLDDDAMNGEFIYDVYRLDLGRYTSKDIKGKAGLLQIVSYEQEFLSDEEGSESENFEDDDDSNAEDYFANDYPDEESYISDIDGELEEEFDFDQSFEIEEVEEDLYNFDLDSDDYVNSDDFNESDSDFDDDYDEDCLDEMGGNLVYKNEFDEDDSD